MLFKSFSLSPSHSLFQNLFVFKRQAFYLDFAMLLSDALGYNFVYTLHFLRKRINTQTSRDGFIVRWSCERTKEHAHTRKKVQTLVRVSSSSYVRMLPVEILIHMSLRVKNGNLKFYFYTLCLLSYKLVIHIIRRFWCFTVSDDFYARVEQISTFLFRPV